MNIALIGYGKMGKIIEKIALSRGHNIVGKSTSKHPINELDFSKIDVAIEFSTPIMAVRHIEHCVNNNTPVVVGTTAWDSQLPYVKDVIENKNGSLLYTSNFSIGVNLFFEINRKLAELMSNYSQYKPEVEEIHHTEKLDAPSGTATSIANDILSLNNNINSWTHKEKELPVTTKSQMGVVSQRINGVPGTHEVKYKSEIDTIEFKHTAHNRNGFAIGAVLAAEWLHGKTGTFTMQDVIKH